MAEEKEAVPSTDVRKDYTEVEFELGDMEFEAKGKAVVVERLFRLLLDKLEAGKIPLGKVKYEDDEEDEEEEDEEGEEKEEEEEPESSEESEEESEPETPPEETSESTDGEPTLDPPPEWDTFDEEPPAETDAEREARDPSGF
ncbi:MAG: hypothetical protein RTU30_06365 [Candidatus Thorarchaeota archaeon]